MAALTEFLISVDPGAKMCGVAFFDGRRLLDCCWVGGPSLTETAVSVYDWKETLVGDAMTFLACEQMQIYKVSKGDPNDLLSVQLVVGALASHYPYHKLYKPREWKGQAPKNVIQKRVSKALDADEFEVLRPWFNNHNVVDAVGIGLFHLGRLGK